MAFSHSLGRERPSLAKKFERAGIKYKPPEDGVLSHLWIDRSAPKGAAFAYVVYDAKQTGLGINVAPSGKMTWCLQTLYPGALYQARRKLGTYPALKLAAARRKAAEWLALIESGTDPAEAAAEALRAKQQERAAEALQNKQTFAAVAERFIAEYVAGQRRGKAVAREIRNYLVAAWGPRPISSIEPRDVRELIGKIKAGTHAQARRRKNGDKKGAAHQAENVLTAASVLFKWAVHEDIIPVSPTASLSKKMIFKEAQIGPRQRRLKDEDELPAFWRASQRLGYPFGPLYQLLLLTGCRMNEIARAQWSELHPNVRKAIRDARKAGRPVDWQVVSTEAKVLVIPPARFKSDVEHHVPLSDDALRIIEHLPHWSLCDYLFSVTGVGPINSMSAGKKQLDAWMLRYLRALARMRGEDAAALEPFVIHDLRRVVRSHVGAIRLPLPTEDEKLLPKEKREKREKERRNIPDHICEMVLGHGRKGLQRTYDMNTHAPEIREALDAWAVRLREIVGPPPPVPTAGTIAHNVVALPKQKKRASS